MNRLSGPVLVVTVLAWTIGTARSADLNLHLGPTTAWRGALETAGVPVAQVQAAPSASPDATPVAAPGAGSSPSPVALPTAAPIVSTSPSPSPLPTVAPGGNASASPLGVPTASAQPAGSPPTPTPGPGLNEPPQGQPPPSASAPPNGQPPSGGSRIPSGASTPGPAAAPAPGSPTSVPGSSAAGRFHLHRPGTDVDGDLLSGSLASHVFVLKGNVVLHSDPKIDREMAEASESDEPLSVTADEIDVDQLAFTYVAKGHVHFVQGTRSGFADLAILNEQAHTLDLVGNASVLDGEHRTTAAKMHYDTADKQFAGGGDVRIYAPAPTPNPSSATPPPKHKRRLPL